MRFLAIIRRYGSVPAKLFDNVAKRITPGTIKTIDRPDKLVRIGRIAVYSLGLDAD
jgi:hypothetical protein